MYNSLLSAEMNLKNADEKAHTFSKNKNIKKGRKPDTV